MSKFKLYMYSPSQPAAMIFIIVFFILFCAHTFQIFRTRGWYFTAMAIGAIMESIGYIGRYLGHDDPTSKDKFILQTVLLLVAPSLFAASIYVVLGRTIVALGAEKISLIRVSWLTAFFVTGDVLSFLIQAGGGGLLSSAEHANIGKTIVLVGLVVQIMWFGGFLLVSVIFHFRMRNFNVPADKAEWTRLMYALYASSIIILARCIFRLFEFGGGHDGVIMRNEWYIYVFDATLMTIVVVLFNVVHPPTYFLRMNRSTASISARSHVMEERNLRVSDM